MTQQAMLAILWTQNELWKHLIFDYLHDYDNNGMLLCIAVELARLLNTWQIQSESLYYR